MKKIIGIVLGLLVSFFVLTGVVMASDTGWEIKNFSVNATIEADRTTTIEEEIVVDFGNLQKRGIFRYIPYRYTRSGNTYNVRIKFLSITDQDGKDLPYTFYTFCSSKYTVEYLCLIIFKISMHHTDNPLLVIIILKCILG